MKAKKTPWTIQGMLSKTDLSSEECRAFLSLADEIKVHVVQKTEELIKVEIGVQLDRIETIQKALLDLRHGPDIRIGVVTGTVAATTALEMLKQGYALAVSDIVRALGGDFDGLQQSLKPRVFNQGWADFTGIHAGEC